MANACPVCSSVSDPTTRFAPYPFHRCPACGLVFRPGVASGELSALYTDEYFARYPRAAGYLADERQRAFEARRRLQWMATLPAAPLEALLEIGCAGGHFLTAALGAGYAPTGIEPAPRLAAQAAESTGLPVQSGTVETVRLFDASLGVACAWHVLEHLADPLTSVVKLRQALVPGGLLVAEVPNAGSARAARLGAAWPALDPEHHVLQFDRTSLERLMTSAGLDVLDVHTVAWSEYHQPGSRLRPRRLAQYARQIAIERAWPLRPHEWRHELLRIAARSPREPESERRIAEAPDSQAH